MNIIASHNLILPKYLIIVKEKGSKNSKARAREGGASAFTAVLSFFSVFLVPPSRRKIFRAKPKQAGEKEGGWGEGIFVRPRFPIPISPPPPKFVFRFAKCAAKKIDVVFASLSRARTTDFLLPETVEKHLVLPED